MNVIVGVVISYLIIVSFSSITIATHTTLVVPETIYSDLRRSFERLYWENVNLMKKIEQVKEEKKNLIFIQLQYEDLQRCCEESYRERDVLSSDLEKCEKFKMHLQWKIIIQQAVDYYEREFDNLELRGVKSSFQLNQTLLNSIDYDDDYDCLAERRRQRWVFYLENPPSAFWYFNDLIKRIEKSSYTKEEFAKGLAILYKQLTRVIFKETMETDDFVRPISSYKDVNFVIPLLIMQYTKTGPITRILNEFKSPEQQVFIGEENSNANNLSTTLCCKT